MFLFFFTQRIKFWIWTKWNSILNSKSESLHPCQNYNTNWFEFDKFKLSEIYFPKVERMRRGWIKSVLSHLTCWSFWKLCVQLWAEQILKSFPCLSNNSNLISSWARLELQESSWQCSPVSGEKLCQSLLMVITMFRTGNWR